MSLQSSQAALVDALKQLRRRWDQVRQRWDDPVSRQIQAEFVDPLDGMVHAAARAIGQASDVMASAHQDCADDT